MNNQTIMNEINQNIQYLNYLRNNNGSDNIIKHMISITDNLFNKLNINPRHLFMGSHWNTPENNLLRLYFKERINCELALIHNPQ